MLGLKRYRHRMYRLSVELAQMLADQIAVFSQLVRDAHKTAKPAVRYTHTLNLVMQQLASSAQVVAQQWPCLCTTQGPQTGVHAQTVTLEQLSECGRVPHDLLLDCQQLALDLAKVRGYIAVTEPGAKEETTFTFPDTVERLRCRTLTALNEVCSREYKPLIWKKIWQPSRYPSSQYQFSVALCAAIRSCSDQELQRMLQSVNDPRVLYCFDEETGECLLQYAVSHHSSLAALRMVLVAVLRSGQSIDEVTNKSDRADAKQTALSIAVRTNQPDAVQILCSWGAAIALPKFSGKSILAASPLFVAAQQADNSIYMMLQQWATYGDMADVCETGKTCAEVGSEVCSSFTHMASYLEAWHAGHFLATWHIVCASKLSMYSF